MGAARVPWRAVKELRKTNKKWADEVRRGGRAGGCWPDSLTDCASGGGKEGEDGGKGQHFFASALPSFLEGSLSLSLSPLSLSETSNLTSGSP